MVSSRYLFVVAEFCVREVDSGGLGDVGELNVGGGRDADEPDEAHDRPIDSVKAPLTRLSGC